MKNSLLKAYLNAEYHFDTGDGWRCLKVGQNEGPAQAWLAMHAKSWCFITACNPASIALCEAENLARQENLRRQLETLGWPCLPARAEEPQAPSETFTEAGHLVLDQPLDQVVALGQEFGQNALLYGGEQQAARILVLNPDWRGDIAGLEVAQMWEQHQST